MSEDHRVLTGVASFGVRRAGTPWVAAAAAACACAAVSLVDPTRTAMSPPCPFKVVTGWWCPFCGATRSASRLFRGDLAGAWHFNALFVVTIPFVVLAWFEWAQPGRIGLLDRTRRLLGRRRAGVITSMLVGAAAWVLLRNVGPGAAWFRYPGS
ncbi:MAG: DUF2752 domain-containing protein [Microthrixaceae bacterium]